MRCGVEASLHCFLFVRRLLMSFHPTFPTDSSRRFIFCWLWPRRNRRFQRSHHHCLWALCRKIPILHNDFFGSLCDERTPHFGRNVSTPGVFSHDQLPRSGQISGRVGDDILSLVGTRWSLELVPFWPGRRKIPQT